MNYTEFSSSSADGADGTLSVPHEKGPGTVASCSSEVESWCRLSPRQEDDSCPMGTISLSLI